MASNRAFKNLASLRNSFEDPVEDDRSGPEEQEKHSGTVISAVAMPMHQVLPAPMLVRAYESAPATSPLTGKIDRRRLKKVLKTPSVSLSVAVRAELHEDVSTMLFARKSTWIALLDQLLTEYVAEAKAQGQFPK